MSAVNNINKTNSYEDTHEFLKQLLEQNPDDDAEVKTLRIDENKKESTIQNIGEETIDNREREDADIISIMSLTKLQLSNILIPKTTHRTSYIVLDSRFRENIEPDKAPPNYKWNYTASPFTFSGTVNDLTTTRNVVSIRIHEFFINAIQTTPFGSSNNQRLPAYNKVMINIEEFNAQSFIRTTGERFHFWGTLADRHYVSPPWFCVRFNDSADVCGTNEQIFRYTDGNNGVFNFREPFTNLESFTLKFTNFTNDLTLNADYFGFTFTSGNGVDNNGSFVISSPANLIVAGIISRIYVTGFETDNAADAVLSRMINNPNGLVAAFTSTTQANIQTYDLNYQQVILPAMVGTQIGKAYVYVDFFRVVIPMELTYILNDEIDNS